MLWLIRLLLLLDKCGPDVAKHALTTNPQHDDQREEDQYLHVSYSFPLTETVILTFSYLHNFYIHSNLFFMKKYLRFIEKLRYLNLLTNILFMKYHHHCQITVGLLVIFM
jgi:hypothetical protein